LGRRALGQAVTCSKSLHLPNMAGVPMIGAYMAVARQAVPIQR
jgi:hypothetical protein